MTAPDPAPGFCTAADLLGRFASLGIPHFQRGLVWGDDLVARLLESLYLGTPCGTVILWKPLVTGSADPGVPLVDGHVCDALVVDGQQRLRSLHEALGTGRQDRGEAWHVYLPKAPETARFFREADPRPQMFRHLFRGRRDDRILPGHRPPPEVPNVVALDDLLGGRPFAELRPRFHPSEPAALDETEFERAFERIRTAVREMQRRPLFAVVTLEERRHPDGTREHDLASVVSLYNRINSSGKPVEAEERTFALLVANAPDETEGWLRECYAAAHGGYGPGGDADALERDGLLRRERERMFGFKFFLRTLAHVAWFSCGLPRPRGGVAPEHLARPELAKALADASTRRNWFAATVRIVGALRRVLDALGCDDLRWLPETSTLNPIVDLLLRFPELASEGTPENDFLQAVVLSTFLHPDRSIGLQDRLARALECDHRIERVAQELRTELDPGGGLAYRLEEQLGAAQSHQHRLVLLLYWLLRHREARDFRYDGLPACGVPGEERPLARGENERQHLVPYARLRKLYGLDGGRLGTHPANDIGNLTWISRTLNHFESGLGDRPADLENEPFPNRVRHFVNDNALLDLYQLLVDDLASREDFERFCALRRRSIARGFENWLRELWRGAALLRPGLRASAPAASLEAAIEGFGYPADVRDELQDFLRTVRPHRRKAAEGAWQLRAVRRIRRASAAGKVRTVPQVLLGVGLETNRIRYWWNEASGRAQKETILDPGDRAAAATIRGWSEALGVTRPDRS